MSQVAGYVLAGGRSSRMGRDKALLELVGRPLVALAVEKLGEVCGSVSILSSRRELAGYGPLVADLHPGCGPVGGIEAALAHSACAWSLFLPVDMPFVPAPLLASWVRGVVASEVARASFFVVDGRAQPALCLVHRDAGPFVAGAVTRGEFKLLPVFEGAAAELARGTGVGVEEVLVRRPAPDASVFANLNTPEEFAAAVGGGWLLSETESFEKY